MDVSLTGCKDANGSGSYPVAVFGFSGVVSHVLLSELVRNSAEQSLWETGSRSANEVTVRFLSN